MSVLGQYFINQWMMKQRQEAEAARLAQVRTGVQSLLGSPGEEIAGPVRPGEDLGSIGGTGLLADPRSPTNQLQFAAGLMGLPGMQGPGSQMVSGIIGQQYQDARAEAANAQQAAQFRERQDRAVFESDRAFDASEYWSLRQDNRQAAAAARQAQAHEMQQQIREAQLRGTRIEADAAARREAMDARARAAGRPEEELPSGYRYAYTPRDGVGGPVMPGPADWTPVPVRGTPQWTAASKNVQGTSFALEDLDRLRSLVAQAGPEAFGELSAQMGTLWGNTLSAIAAQRGLGTVQASDVEFVQDAGLENPGQWTFSRKNTILAQIEEVRRTFLRQHRWFQNEYRGYGIPMPRFEDTGREANLSGLDEISAEEANAAGAAGAAAPVTVRAAPRDRGSEPPHVQYWRDVQERPRRRRFPAATTGGARRATNRRRAQGGR